ncbi:MAG TPA: TonB-dependent receptor [Bryobacteraceae bacterium]
MIKFLSVLVAVTAVLTAQSQTGLQGQIKDAQGKPIGDAQVRLLRQDASTLLDAVTPASGSYRFDRVVGGAYVLEVQKEGFRTAVANVQVDRGQVKEQDVVLSIAGVNQTVFVTASGEAQVDSEISKAVSVVDKDEIENRNAVQLADIVRYTPGVQVQGSGGMGQFTNFRTRGLQPDATSILVDGLRFRDASGTQADASSFLQTLNFIDADRVEILRGSGSSLYGTNAVGGAINVVTDPGGGPLHGELQTEGGNLGLFRGRGSLAGGAFKDRLKFTAGFLHLNVTKGVDGHDAYRSTGGQGFVHYDINSHMTISDRLWGSDDFAQTNDSPSTVGIPAANLPASGVIQAIPLPPSQVAILQAGGTPNYGNATFIPDLNDPTTRRSSWFLTNALLFHDVVNANVNWQASYQRVHTNRIYESISGDVPAVNYGNYVGDTDTFNIHGTAQVAPWLSLTGGYEFEREGYFDHQDNNQPGPNRVLESTNISQSSNAAYFATQTGLFGRRLQISFSGRFEDFSLSKPNFLTNGPPSVYASVPLQSPPSALTGDVSIAYLIPKSNTKLRAHVGNAYRAPSLYERFGGGFSNDPITGIITFSAYGDPRLAPDRYNSADGGVDQYLFKNRVRVSATYFYTRIVHIIQFDESGIINPLTDPYQRLFGYINGSGGISRGAEIDVEARPTKGLILKGSYTYTNAETDQDITVPGVFKAFGVQAHTVSLVATKQWGKRFDTTFMLYHGSSYYAALFAGFESSAYLFPGFTNAGVMLNYRIWSNEKRSVRAYTKVDNIFNQAYYESGYLAARATFASGLGFSF